MLEHDVVEWTHILFCTVNEKWTEKVSIMVWGLLRFVCYVDSIDVLAICQDHDDVVLMT